MTKEEAINHIRYGIIEGNYPLPKELGIEACEMAIKALEQQPCDDCISRQAAIYALRDAENHAFNSYYKGLIKAHKIIANLPPVTPQPKIGHCRDCKWWKDSDGFYRRGGRDDKCPINCREVFEGNGYCYLFEPKI